MLSYFDAHNSTYTAGLGGIRTDAGNDYNGALAMYVSRGGTQPLTGAAQLTEVGRFVSAGYLGIGTNTPTVQLHVTGSAALAANGGNVGIGVVVPTSKLHVSGMTQSTNYVTDVSGVATPVILGNPATVSGRLNLDFAAAGLQMATITGGTIISGINYSAGASVTLRLFAASGGGFTTAQQIAYPTGWRFVSSYPTGMPVNKMAILTLQCLTTSPLETGVAAAFVVEPDNPTLFTAGYVATVSVKTTNYTFTTADYAIVCNSASPFTVTLIAASANPGRVFVVKNKGSADITLDATALGTIDGDNTYTLFTYQSVTLVSDGTVWNII
jgi:hypothetical protein